MATKRLIANLMTAGDPTHPGELIKEELDFMGLTQRSASEQLEVNPAILSQVIKGKRAVNARLAIKLEKLLNIDADFFMRLQVGYDIALLRKKMAGSKRKRLARERPVVLKQA